MRHFRAQYCDKKICNKNVLQYKDIFGPWMSKGQGKLLKGKQGSIIAYFGCSI